MILIIVLGWFVLFKIKKGSLLGTPIKQGVHKVKKLLKLGVEIQLLRPHNRAEFFSSGMLLRHLLFYNIPLCPIISEIDIELWTGLPAIVIRTGVFFLNYGGKWGVLWKRGFKKIILKALHFREFLGIIRRPRGALI